MLVSITLAYAESCSSGQGSLSYQISGCGDQACACCTGQWCDWTVTGCATCNDTSKSTACSNVNSNYCKGTATATRSVTGSCSNKGCTYSSWSSWNTGGCTSYVSCTATGDSTACSNVSSSYCSGTATRTKTTTNYLKCCGSSCTGVYSSTSYGTWNTNSCVSAPTCTYKFVGHPQGPMSSSACNTHRSTVYNNYSNVGFVSSCSKSTQGRCQSVSSCSGSGSNYYFTVTTCDCV